MSRWPPIALPCRRPKTAAKDPLRSALEESARWPLFWSSRRTHSLVCPEELTANGQIKSNHLFSGHKERVIAGFTVKSNLFFLITNIKARVSIAVKVSNVFSYSDSGRHEDILAGTRSVGGKHGISKAYGMAHVVRLCGRSVQRHHVCDENNDSAANCQHDMQRAFHRLRIL